MSFHRYCRNNLGTMHFYNDELNKYDQSNCLTFSNHSYKGYSNIFLNNCWALKESCTPVTAQDLVAVAKLLKKNSSITPEAKEYLKGMMIWWLAQNENNIPL